MRVPAASSGPAWAGAGLALVAAALPPAFAAASATPASVPALTAVSAAEDTPSPSPADQTPPTRPGQPEPYNVYVNGAAGLSWAPSTDDVAVAGYEVYAWIDGEFTQVAQVSPQTGERVIAVVDGLTPGRDYLFYVVAKDAAGNLSPSSYLVRQRAMVEPPIPSPGPGTDTTPPGTPTGLTTVSGMPIPGGVFLAWNGVSDDSGEMPIYDVFRQTDHGWVYVNQNFVPRTMVAHLEGGKAYTFQVVARDAAGNLSNPSAPYTAVAQPEETSSPSPSSSPDIACKVTYAATSWDGGFTANVTITNTGTAAVSGWKLGFDFPRASQRITNGWSAVWTQSGTAVTAENYEWNKTIKPGQSLNLGFNGAHSGENPPPAAFTLNGATCS